MRNERKFTGLALGLTSALVAGTIITAPAAQAQTGDIDQVRLAEPGKDWVARGDAAFVAALGQWSNPAMAPDDVESRSYLVRNMDARPGTWSVRLGEPAVSEYAYFAVGTGTMTVPGGTEAAVDAPATIGDDTLPAPPAPAPGQADVDWLAGPGTVDHTDVSAAVAGTELASIELRSCEAGLVTDWVALPDVTDARFAGQDAQPNISVTFTPDEGDPDDFVEGFCDATPPQEVDVSAKVGEDFEFDVRTSPGDTVAAGGELPDWLTLRDGVLSGTPEAPGTHEVLLTVTDAEGMPSDVLVRITVEPGDPDDDGGSAGSSGFNFWSWLTGLFGGSTGSTGSSGSVGGDTGTTNPGGSGPVNPGNSGSSGSSITAPAAWASPVFGVLFGAVAIGLAIDYHYNHHHDWHWSRFFTNLFG